MILLRLKRENPQACESFQIFLKTHKIPYCIPESIGSYTACLTETTSLAEKTGASGCSSGVEHNLAKVGVEGSNPFARSSFSDWFRHQNPGFVRDFCFWRII